ETTEILPEIFDEPFADPSAVPTYLLSRMTRQRVKVALSGDGGDELFVGYPRYGAFERTNWLLRSPRLVRYAAGSVLERVPRRRYRRAASILRQADPDGYSRFVNVWDPGEIAQIAGARGAENPIYQAAREGTRNLPEPHRPPVLDLVSYLPEDILTKVDRCSMAVSLETRCPILDHRVVELALRLPFRLKRQHGVSKWVLKRLLYRKVPRELVDRPKMGFGVPLPDWFRGPLRARMEEGLRGPRLEELGLDPALPREIWSEFLAGRSHRPELLWSLFALLSWKARWSGQPRGSLPLVENLGSAAAAVSADR
ncbi:MAG TPA: asparagine synthase-related protein, partial [Thermoanaerobaculia bacterium]|nr:asparagine synthase-related protein [Thermoanaerobaculia bacterium]